MRRISPDVGRGRALIIDSNPSLRSMQAQMLRGMNVGTVVQTSRVTETRRALERPPQSVRLQRFVTTSAVFKARNDRETGACVGHVRRLTESVTAEDFDFESASNLLAVLARLHSTEIQLARSDAWITKVAQRFCVSKASTDMLCMAAKRREPHVALIRATSATCRSKRWRTASRVRMPQRCGA